MNQSECSYLKLSICLLNLNLYKLYQYESNLVSNYLSSFQYPHIIFILSYNPQILPIPSNFLQIHPPLSFLNSYPSSIIIFKIFAIIKYIKNT